jgi:hypothetical protein
MHRTLLTLHCTLHCMEYDMLYGMMYSMVCRLSLSTIIIIRLSTRQFQSCVPSSLRFALPLYLQRLSMFLYGPLHANHLLYLCRCPLASQ